MVFRINSFSPFTFITGLIIISWIISITIGMMNVVSRQEAHAVFAVMFLLIVVLLSVSYVVTINKHIKKKRVQIIYQKNFMMHRKNHVVSSKKKKQVKRYWLLKFPAIIIFSYIGCSIMWVFNEIREGFQSTSSSPLFHSFSLLIYSLNFYFPSSICMYLRYLQWKSKKSKTTRRVRSCYRYRDMF